jgi:hypothetical protein
MAIPIDVKLKAQQFQEDIKQHVKCYNPDRFIIQLADLIDQVFQNKETLMGRYPLHFLVHAMEANCAYHRNYDYKELSEKSLNKLIKVYHNYKDPVSRYYLLEQNEFNFQTSLFFIFMARQQFYLQLMDNKNAISRSLILFDEALYPKSINKMRNMFGFGFNDWLFYIFCIYSAVLDKDQPIVKQNFSDGKLTGILTCEQTRNIFKQLAVDIDDVKNNYFTIRESKMIFDPYIRSIFEEKPLFKLSNGDFVVIHKALLLRRFTEGLFDLCYEHFEVEFGQEFGNSFEQYIGKLLRTNSNSEIFSEKDMREYSNEKVCDYVIVTPDTIVIIESKAVEYSAILTSENAVKNDNSTTKVSRAIDQIFSTVNLIKAGIFKDLVGEVSSKKFFSFVVTFKEIYSVNSDEYWTQVILPKTKNPEAQNWNNWFEFRPQIIDCSELENIILILNGENISIFDILKDKLSRPYHEVGDWEPYLSKRVKENFKISILDDKYSEYSQYLLSLSKRKEEDV